MSLVISGRIVPLTLNTTVAPSEAAAFTGKVWIGDDGRVAAVTQGQAPGPPGFSGAAAVNVGSDLVFPGLIDLHSHLAYATLPLWVDKNRTTPFLHHNSWPSRPNYAPEVTWPAYAFITASPHELLAYAEIRALIGGTTSIQGSPPKNRPPDSSLVRNVEDETLGGTIGSNQVLSSTLTLKSEQLGTRATQMGQDGRTFIYHCAEGQLDSTVGQEYTSAETAGCLQSRFVAIHTNAIQPSSYGHWTPPGTVVWSPFSNLWLYGQTTNVRAALDKGIRVCIGSDWGPSGTRNVLGELKVASIVNDENSKPGNPHPWGLTAFELVKMVTANPGDVLKQAWGPSAGRLQKDALGDVVVIAAPSTTADPFKTLLEATESDVRLVVIRGKALYGTTPLMTAAGAAATSSINVDGSARTISLTRPDSPATVWKFSDILNRMEQVRAHPKQEIEQARRQARAAAERGDAVQPLRLALDMPTGIAPVGGLPKDLSQIQVPKIQTLEHDTDFFTSITGRGFHGGLLDKLAAFYA